MTFENAVAVPISYYVGSTGVVVSYILKDESGNIEETGTLTESGVITGLYEGSFTPDAAGVWSVIISVGTISLMQSYPIEFGMLANGTYGLAALGTQLTTIIADLDVPTADSTDDALSRDVIGKKDDASVVTVGTTKSLMAYSKGLLTDLLLVKAKTDLIPATPSTSTDALAALATDDLDHLAKTTYGGAKPAAGTLFDSLFNKDGGQTFSQATDSLEALGDALGLLSGGSLATDAGASHNITTANDQTETLVFESTSSQVRSVSAWFDFGALETAVEGGTVTLRFYSKVDGSNYGAIPHGRVDYTVANSVEYPSFEAMMITGDVKVTIQCSADVTATRAVTYRYIVKELS